MNHFSKILLAEQIQRLDAETITNEPIASIDLMERAALACVNWLLINTNKKCIYKIFCGLGNNGGDGLAIARLLLQHGCEVDVFILRYADKSSNDFYANEQRLHLLNPHLLTDIFSPTELPYIHPTDIVIDAVFGIGLSRTIDNPLIIQYIQHVNSCTANTIAIDVPSGLQINQIHQVSSHIIAANHTLSFQFVKLPFLFSANAPWVGEWHVLPIGLCSKSTVAMPTNMFFVTKEAIQPFVKTKSTFSHKGHFGNALLISGSYGKIGASILAAKACLRSGVGLLTLLLPSCGYSIAQISVPEAMVISDVHAETCSQLPTLSNYTAIGIGPGLGTQPATAAMLLQLLQSATQPLVLDADAINIIAAHPQWLKLLPRNTIITPHVKEFARLTHATENEAERYQLQVEFAITHQIIVVLKGAYTCIALPNGQVFFNSTGNVGMAKGGSGDALTGIIVSLLAQGYNQAHAAIIGVWVHGMAGDKAAAAIGRTSMLASDTITYLNEAFNLLESIPINQQ